jgi:uncharacterized protein with PIN domain
MASLVRECARCRKSFFYDPDEHKMKVILSSKVTSKTDEFDFTVCSDCAKQIKSYLQQKVRPR